MEALREPEATVTYRGAWIRLESHCRLLQWYGVSESGRRARHIREHYFASLNPKAVREEWTMNDDLHLIDFINTQGKKWEAATEIFPAKKV